MSTPPAPASNTRLTGTFETGAPEPERDEDEAVDRTALDFPGLVVTSREHVWRVSEGQKHNEISGSYCKVCGEWLDLDSANTADTESVECSECKSYISVQDELVGVGVIEEDVRIIVNPEKAVKERTWYHSTDNEDWAERLSTTTETGKRTLVHLGSEDAADYRTKHIVDEEAGGTRYIYKVRIKSEAAVSSEVQMDKDWRAPQQSNGLGEDVVDRDGYQLNGVTAYVNEHEAIGSVSLIAHPDSMEIIERIAYRYDREWDEWVNADDIDDEGDF